MLMIKVNGVGVRLQEERERLGFKGSEGEKDFSRKLGVSRQLVRAMEASENTLEVEHLGCLAKNGVDINYVLTGRYPHSPGELSLLENYRAAGQIDRGHMRRLALRLRNRR